MLLTSFDLGCFLFARCSEQFFLLFDLIGRPLDRFVGDDRAPGWFLPSAVFIEAAIGPDGSDDRVCRGRVDRGFLHDFFECESEAPGTLLEEVQGVCVTVNCRSVAEFEFRGQVAGPPPHEEGLFDRLAFRMAADLAVDPVVVEPGSVALASVWPVAPGLDVLGLISRFGIFW